MALQLPSGRALPGPAGKFADMKSRGASIEAIQAVIGASLANRAHGSEFGRLHAPAWEMGMGFDSPSWVAALQCLDVDEFDENNEMFEHCVQRTLSKSTTHKVPKLLLLVVSLKLRPSGEATAVLKDPTGQLKAAVHRAVLESEPGFGPGATVSLKEASLLCPWPGMEYLIVTQPNILQVFPAARPPRPSPQIAAPIPSPSYQHTAAGAGGLQAGCNPSLTQQGLDQDLEAGHLRSQCHAPLDELQAGSLHAAAAAADDALPMAAAPAHEAPAAAPAAAPLHSSPAPVAGPILLPPPAQAQGSHLSQGIPHRAPTPAGLCQSQQIRPWAGVSGGARASQWPAPSQGGPEQEEDEDEVELQDDEDGEDDVGGLPQFNVQGLVLQPLLQQPQPQQQQQDDVQQQAAKRQRVGDVQQGLQLQQPQQQQQQQEQQRQGMMLPPAAPLRRPLSELQGQAKAQSNGRPFVQQGRGWAGPGSKAPPLQQQGSRFSQLAAQLPDDDEDIEL